MMSQLRSIVQEGDVKQTLGKIDSPELDLQLAIDLVASSVGEEGNVIKDLSKDSAEDKFTRLQEASSPSSPRATVV